MLTLLVLAVLAGVAYFVYVNRAKIVSLITLKTDKDSDAAE